MKEQFRAILAGDLDRREAAALLDRREAAALLDRWCARAQRSRMEPFVRVARTMRERRDLIPVS